jgi:hypothetical protein
MSSAISAENNTMGSRAKLVLTVFSCIGLGVFGSGITYLILLAAFKGAILDDITKLQWVWRLLFGIGLVPLILTLYARLNMKESQPYTKYVSRETSLVGKGKRGLAEQLKDFREYFANLKHARTLFAVSASWFLLWVQTRRLTHSCVGADTQVATLPTTVSISTNQSYWARSVTALAILLSRLSGTRRWATSSWSSQATCPPFTPGSSSQISSAESANN